MRPLPHFPDYHAAKPPAAKRWLGTMALLVLFAGAGIALLRGANTGVGIILAGMLSTMLFISFCWLFSLLYYRFSVHHSATWQQEVAEVHNHWWYQHRRHFSLQDVVLIGPAGAERVDWLRLLQREQKPPVERKEANGLALRVARIFSPDVSEREHQLARMLVLQWKNQREGKKLTSPQRCFWLGSESAWQVFSDQAMKSFPGITLPATPEFWQGENTLSGIAAALSADENGTEYLIAGCQSEPASSQAQRAAGEAAVLWLAGSDGPVMLSRGEFYDPCATESLEQVCERAQRQSELDAPPDACMLFSHPEQPALAVSGWNMTHHLQDNYWGYTGKLDALIVISLAAIYAQSQSQSCGWIATDFLHPLALGIVKPHGNQQG
ncbi:hypothetical protein [Pectobacterium odoriferum]|uniref:hypothetical protein n=1 Tax=Pectobacterium odoriferum TaxID=78398 RepID=UPI00215659D1|nr:hypothetical protein [Pectobacterium odoriferum]